MVSIQPESQTHDHSEHSQPDMQQFLEELRAAAAREGMTLDDLYEQPEWIRIAKHVCIIVFFLMYTGLAVEGLHALTLGEPLEAPSYQNFELQGHEFALVYQDKWVRLYMDNQPEPVFDHVFDQEIADAFFDENLGVVVIQLRGVTGFTTISPSRSETPETPARSNAPQA